MGARTNLLLESPIPVESQAPEYNITERIGAAFDLGMKDIFTSRKYRDNIYDELESKDPIGITQPAELNEKFQDVEMPFTKPTSYLLANEINEEAKEKKRLMNIISNNGKSDSFGISLLGGLAAHATDPVEAGVDILIGLSTAGLGTVAKYGAKAGKIGLKSAKMLNRTNELIKANKLTASMVEGVAANAALEPYFFKSSVRSQEDYTVNDALISVVGGGMVFPAAAFGLAKGGRIISDNAPWMGQAIKGAMGQMAAGKKINLDAIIELRNNHLKGISDVPADSIRSGYKFTKLEDVDINQKKFYVSTTQSKKKIQYSDHHPIGDYMGDEGVHITDNPNIANQYANDPLQDAVGGIHEVNLNEANLFNINQAIETPEGTNIKSILKEIDPELAEAFGDARTIKEGLDNLKTQAEFNKLDTNQVLKQVHNSIKEQGYNGTIHSEDGIANHAYIYDEQSLKHSESFKADTKAKPKVNNEKIVKAKDDLLNNNKNDFFHNEFSQKDIDETPDLSPADFERATIEQVKLEQNNIKEMVDSGFASDADIKALREVEIEEELMKGRATIFQKIKNCLIGGR